MMLKQALSSSLCVCVWSEPPHSPADSDDEDMTDRTSVGVLTGQIKSSILNNNNNNTFGAYCYEGRII